MECRAILLMSFTISLIASFPALAAEPMVVEGRVSAVTVYQGQALVTRDVELTDAQGLVEVVVTNLPQSLLPESLFAEPTEGMEIRSVRYRSRPIQEDVREEVRELDEQLVVVQDKQDAISQERQVLNGRKAYLAQLERFSGDTAHRELKSGVLNAETLKTLSQFLFAERERISKRELELGQQERAVQKERELLVRKRETVAAGSARTVREAVVFANVREAGATKLRLSYLVSEATWSPSYNVRATDARDELTVEYNASVQQMSGEDWNDVQMILSTATPSLVAKAPKLETLLIKLGSIQPPAQSVQSAAANYRQLQQGQIALGKLRGSALSSTSGADRDSVSRRAAGEEIRFRGGVGGWEFGSASTESADKGLNRFANELQLMDFNTALSDLKSQSDRGGPPVDGVSVSYRLANRTSLPSRSDRQLIQIASVPLKGEFYRVATPVLSNFVYEEARVTNTSDDVFLAGPAATFLDGEFVGRGDIPTVSVGESFSVGLGIDSSLRAERELETKEERIQGGNRVVDFTYKLSLENFGNDPVEVRLLDRLPTVGENDIKVTLVKSDEKVSDDQLHQMLNRKNGILRWDVEVPAQAIGTKEKTLRYTMQIEYDKQLSIVGMPDRG